MTQTSSVGIALVLALVGYGLGCLNTGYYLVLWRTGQDVRTLGSGNAGARNVGRVLGRSGFVLTLAGDLLKGVAAVLLARLAGLPEWAWVMVLLAVIAGHLWPLQLHGRGGKGAATALGGILVLSPWVGLAMALTTGVLWMVTKRTVISGVVGALAAPLYGWLMGESTTVLSGLALVLALLAFTHRDNIRGLMARTKTARTH